LNSGSIRVDSLSVRKRLIFDYQQQQDPLESVKFLVWKDTEELASFFVMDG
jgi:hypothetical protein